MGADAISNLAVGLCTATRPANGVETQMRTGMRSPAMRLMRSLPAAKLHQNRQQLLQCQRQHQSVHSVAPCRRLREGAAQAMADAISNLAVVLCTATRPANGVETQMRTGMHSPAMRLMRSLPAAKLHQNRQQLLQCQ